LVVALAIGTEGVQYATAAPASKSAGESTPQSSLQKDADALLAYGSPGVLVEVDTPGHTEKVRSGVGNLATRLPVPWDAEFRIGSFTKTFVSATLLQLVGEGKLSLDDTVGHWLPGVVTGNGNDGDKITVRQVLQHTAGIPDYTNALPELQTQQGFEQNRFRSYTPQQLIAVAMTMPPSFAPGTDWAYSNTDYVLVGMIIQKVTGHSWQHEVTDRIIKPLGLRHTFVPGTSPVIPGPHAAGYMQFSADGPDVDVTTFNPSVADAAGEIISSTADSNRFLRALVRGEVLKPAQLAQMETTVPATEFDPAWPGVRYGLGLLWIPNSCGGEWAHGGDIFGFETRDAVSPDGTRSVVVSLNGDPVGPRPGAPVPTQDPTNGLIDHALCG
jgi:D-alanyl-D-alanine carboxypeptidase